MSKKDYAIALVLRPPLNHWEVISVVETEFERLHKTITYDNRCYDQQSGFDAWINVEENYIRLLLVANNIQDALHKAWTHGLTVAAKLNK